MTQPQRDDGIRHMVYHECQHTDLIRRIDVAVGRIEERVEALPDSIALAVARHAEACRTERTALAKRSNSDPAIPIPRRAWDRIWTALAVAAAAVASWIASRLAA